MPLWRNYRRLFDSDVADFNNAGKGGFAGAIVGALFLDWFVPESTPWAHFDTFAWNDTSRPGRPAGRRRDGAARGARGAGVMPRGGRRAMKRWAVGALVVLAVLAGGAWWLYTSLDFVVKSAIERVAPDILGVSVGVRAVKLSAADGRGTLRGIEIGNPPGYSSPRALRAGTVSVGIDPATLASDVVVIRDILVQSPEIAYELRDGTNNLDAIRRNIEAYVKRAAGDAAAQGAAGRKAPGRRYVIGRITLRGARVTMTNPLLRGGGLDLPASGHRPARRRQAHGRGERGRGGAHRHLGHRGEDRTERAHQRRGAAPRRPEGARDALRGLLR